jgi:hypothetical protein
MKSKKTNLNSTLEQLENDNWNDPGEVSGLVRTIHRLRKKPLREFTTEDLRVTIVQQFSLEFLIPLAIDQLRKDILSEGNYYPGDLLKNVLEVEAGYWGKNKSQWEAIRNLFNENSDKFVPANEYKDIMMSFERFKQIDIFND